MNPSALSERGYILGLSGNADLRFEPKKPVRMEAKETGRKNIFSRVGIGADGAEFVIRKTSMTLHDAILWNGQHYFLTNIEQVGICPVYYKLTAARVPCEIVTVSRTMTAMGKSGEAVRTVEKVGSFPGCLTEKYLGEEIGKSHVELEKRLIVVAPKEAVYRSGDIFEIFGESWRVVLCHDLEQWKNEYEVERVEDV